jgi:uncharacterized protein YndB with AHSA1/START domain
VKGDDSGATGGERSVESTHREGDDSGATGGERSVESTHGNEVELSVYIDASPATVFRYFTDAERMCQWMGVAAELDAQPGGTFRVDVNGRNVTTGTYLEIVPAEKVVFTWGWEGDGSVPPGSTTVEVVLAPDGDGTLLRLRHHDLPDDAAATLHTSGWTHYTARLQIVASGGDPGPDEFTAVAE